MSSNTIGGNRPAILPTLQTAVETVANNSVVTQVGDVATTIADKVDQFDTASAALGRAARTRTGARIAGAVSGAVLEKLRPGTFDAAGRTLTNVAGKMGLSPGVMKGAANVAGSVAHGAGIAAIGYDAIRSFTDTKADLGSRTAQAGAALAVGAATFIPGVGTAIVVTDVITGGGVTGGAKGLVALGDAALTGDRDALNSWVDSAKSGDQGWLLKAASNNKTVARVTGAVAEGVINRVATVKRDVATLTAGASALASRGWRALTSW